MNELLPGIPNPYVDDGEPFESHVRTLARMAEQSFPRSRGGGGDGIVWVGGGKYWPGIVAGINTLRDIGCDIPVELWYDSKTEPITISPLRRLDLVRIRDIRNVRPLPEKIEGWENKLTAIANTDFDRIAFFDADAYAVEHLRALFDHLSNSPPFLFWDDLPKMAAKIRWGLVWPSGSANIPPVQGGQLLIDVNRAWDLIVMSHWQNQHSWHYYRNKSMLYYGDQHAWNVSLAAMESVGRHSMWQSLGPARWKSVAFICSFAGRPYVIHRCGGKLFPIEHIPVGKSGFANPKWNVFPQEATLFKNYAEALAYKDDSEQEFSQIYRARIWGPGSGAGSRTHEANAYLELINPLLAGKSVVDLGCGDGMVASGLQAGEYQGYDCVPGINWYAPGRNRKKLDFYKCRESLKNAEVCLVKDVLHHWPNRMIEDFLSWLCDCGKYETVYLTQDVHQHDVEADTYLGGYRALHPDYNPLKKFPLKLVRQFLHKAVLELSVKKV
jgi:SAM-dependent methyltransferase